MESTAIEIMRELPFYINSHKNDQFTIVLMSVHM